MLATIVPVVTERLPVASAVAVVVPTVNLSSDSSNPINALLPVEPRSIKIPRSLLFAPDKPLLNSIKWSAIVVLVDETVVVVPFTVKLPAIVTLFGKPIVNFPELSPTSTSLSVPMTVTVPPNAIAVEVELSDTVIVELLNDELPIFDKVFEAPDIVLLVNV